MNTAFLMQGVHGLTPVAHAVEMSHFGTELPIRDVRCHGEYWGQSGLAADVVKMAGMTQLGH